MTRFILIWGILVIFLAGCSGTFFVPNQRKAQYLSESAGWEYRVVQVTPFSLVAAISPRRIAGVPLVIYIEGDGLAFLGQHTISADPTPKDPVALRMALSHPSGPVAYLARPCQYVMTEPCRPIYWTSHRYSPEVVASVSLAIDEIKQMVGAKSIIVAGYSGGGAIAVLVAAGRSDVVGIVTVVANTDIAYWTAYHGLTPLYGSLDPSIVYQQVANIPQVHFVGGRDDVVPPEVGQSFLARIDNHELSRLVKIDNFRHDCCWADEWEYLAYHPDFAIITGWPLMKGSLK